MNCPNCAAEMTAMALDGHQGSSVDIDLCTACQSFWFDKYESLRLSPASTLHLMKLIGEQSSSGTAPFSESLRCPRCGNPLSPTQDMQRNTRFHYWRCRAGHGRFIRYFEFLREKDFIRPLTPQQLKELREHIQFVNCSNCGAPVDLAAGSSCSHCKSPVSMLDMKQPEALLEQLRQAAAPRPIDPALPLEMIRAKRDVESAFGEVSADSRWWSDASSSGLVHACLHSVARWLGKSGVRS